MYSSLLKCEPTTKSTVFHIGFDDTDSTDGSCTTFLCYNIVKKLLASGKVKLLDYPNLIRLNPNIPWKTRGNAALSIRISTSLGRKQVFEICKKHVKKFASSPRANAGLVLYEGVEIPEKMRQFSRRALYTVLGIREATSLMEELEMDSFSLRSRQGLVGAIAAVGNVLSGDHTFELIAYRKKLSLPRKLVKSKIVEVSKANGTFSSYDETYDRVMIAPHGPDPVLCGIRGETATAVKNAFELLSPVENLLGWMIFRSNQGTGEHLSELIHLGEPVVYSSGRVFGRVLSRPKFQLGGHVFFTIGNEDGSMVCACYEPTAGFRKDAMQLREDDYLEVGGGVRKPTKLHPIALNLEYFRPLKLATRVEYHNPVCTNCKVSMSSMGASQGYRCPKCGSRSSAKKNTKVLARELKPRQIYLPPVKAHRHLTRPKVRYSMSGKCVTLPIKLVQTWYN